MQKGTHVSPPTTTNERRLDERTDGKHRDGERKEGMRRVGGRMDGHVRMLTIGISTVEIMSTAMTATKISTRLKYES